MKNFILEILKSIDTKLFILINTNLSNPIFDATMPLFDKTFIFIPFMLIPYFLALIFDRKNRLMLAILIPLIIILVDQTGLLIKKTILRPRPWAGMDPNLVIHLIPQKGMNYSFPSNHAANISGLAIIFSSIYRKYNSIFWGIAIIVIFSRVYIGVHYPSDVIFGWFLGITYGAFLIIIWRYFIIKNYNKISFN